MLIVPSPVIIIFDSLAFKHVPTIKTLREYLVDEAKSKRGMDLAKEDISALHAKVSPSPTNWETRKRLIAGS
jgi:sentrin-specific protease 7